MRLGVILLGVGLLFAAGHPGRAASGDSAPTAFDTRDLRGSVVWTQSVTGYTYVEIDTGSETIFAAGPATPVRVGDRVLLPRATLMRDFYSPTLGRRFERIYFAPSIQVESDEGASEASAS